MKIDHNNIQLIETWLVENNQTPVLEDDFVREVYHRVLEPRFQISKTTSRKQRRRCFKLQYDFVRRDLLKILYKINGYSAAGLAAGYVYAIGNPAWPDQIKIGCAIDVNDRLQSYQTSSPFRDYFLIDYYFVYDRREEEHNLHARFPDRNNEWVAISLCDVKQMFEVRKEERVILPTDEVVNNTRSSFYVENGKRVFTV